jgi:CRISPR/Cas system-associated endonuclease Cas1
LEVRKKGEITASTRLIDVAQLCVFGNVQVSTPLIRELFTREVPTCWFTYGGWFSGIAESPKVCLGRTLTSAGHRSWSPPAADSRSPEP